MNLLIRLGILIKKAVLAVIGVACIAAIFWGILYKLWLPFTPLWLDEISIAVIPLALLTAWMLSRSANKQSADKDVDPAPAVPDAAAQLASDDQPPSHL